MGLHAQAFAAMPLRPALAEVIYDLLDDERTNTANLILFDDLALTGLSQVGIDDDATATDSAQRNGDYPHIDGSGQAR